MGDKVDTATRSRIMRSIKSKGTKPELIMQQRLVSGFYRGTRFAFNADFCYPDAMVAVFVDGDFWHGKSFDESTTKLNQHWREHIKSNMVRDAKNRTFLRRSGWIVFCVWESDVLTSADFLARIINKVIAYRRSRDLPGAQTALL